MKIPRLQRIFIVDDHKMVIDGLCSLLTDVPNVEVVGYCSKPLEVVEMLSSINVDILLTDINMPEMSGVELTRLVKKKFPGIKVLALSMFGDRQVVTQMMDAGISGYILKNTGKQELLEALTKISNNQSFFSADITLEIMKSFTNDTCTRLTNREIEIVRLIEKENSNKQIADTLFISERTVETHRKNIFRKTNTQSIIGLLKYAYKNKII